MGFRFTKLLQAIRAGNSTPSVPSFYFNFSNPQNVTLGAAQARGTITSTQNAHITMSASLSRVVGVAPLYVNIDMTGTTSDLTANATHDLFYSVNWGDSGAGQWANGVQSAGLTDKNWSFGPVGGHVFETPGTYLVTPTSTDGVNSASKPGYITVLDPNVVYAGANTICLSTSGNFTGAPSGSQQFTVSSDMSAAFNTYKASNKRILFCKADAWTCTSNLDIANITGLTIDGYGTGAARSVKFGTTSDTLVNVTPSPLGGSVFSVNASTSDIRIGHFKIAADGTTMAGTVNATISGVLFHKIEIRGCSNGYDAFNGVGVGVNKVMDQLCLYECLVDDLYGTPFVDYTTGLELHGGCGAFVSVVRGGVMGCYIDTCNHGEQSLRIPYISRGHISNNYIARPNQSKNILKIHGFIYEQMPLYSEKWVVSGNVLDCRNGYSYGAPLGGTSIATGLTTVSEVGNCAIVVGPGGGVNSGGFGDERVRNGIIENNYTYGCRGNPKSNLSFAGVYCPNMTVRNNIADFAIGDGVSSVTGPYSYTYVHMVSAGPGTADPTIGIRVYNNTLYTNCASAEILNVAYIAEPTAGTVQIDQVSVKNNILYAPHHSMTFNRVSVYRASGTGTNVVAENNTDEVSTINATPNFVVTPPIALTDWRPNTGSYAINTGATVPVLRDFNNISRYGATYDMGAVLP